MLLLFALANKIPLLFIGMTLLLPVVAVAATVTPVEFADVDNEDEDEDEDEVGTTVVNSLELGSSTVCKKKQNK